MRARPSRQSHVVAKWEGEGWELEVERPRRFRTELTFRKEKPNRRWGLWTATSGVVLLLVAGLVFALTQMPFHPDPLAKTRDDATAAVKALQARDLASLDQHLAAYRGQPDFAYFFTSQTTPRTLGDALASVAGTGADAPFRAGVDPHAYDLDLTDLAGTIALATHGIGDRALPASWAEDFVEATTTPAALYSGEVNAADATTNQRADQDVANKQNLLLLLSRGYWSTNFLETVTKAYWDFDHANGDNGWPGGTLDDAKYAPSPSGVYLTDGMLALNAALTADPAASDWAFTDFQPGTETVDYDGSDHPIGKFTHYLFFEHHFPTSSDGDSVGMTATLTALSSAIDASGGATVVSNTSAADSPMSDSLVLQALAKSSQSGSGCSANPLDYGHCLKAVAEAVVDWVKQHWNHSLLDILSLATFAPPSFDVAGIPVGVTAAATNATWYAVDGDYTDAGLSLGAAVPGLAFTKFVNGAKDSGEVAKAAKVYRASAKAGVTKAVRSMKYGQRMHELRDYGPGFEKEFTLPSGNRVDAINFDTGVVMELKPDSARSMQNGEKQLQGYLDELNKENPRDPPWTGSVVTYPRPEGGK